MITYVIGTEVKDYVKIGQTGNIRSRISSFCTNLPYDIEIIGFYDGLMEPILHRELAQFRKKGEWFNYSVVEILKQDPCFIQITDPFRAAAKTIYDLCSWEYRLPDFDQRSFQLSMEAYAVHAYAMYRSGDIFQPITLDPEKVWQCAGLKNISVYNEAVAELVKQRIIIPRGGNVYWLDHSFIAPHHKSQKRVA